MKILRIYTRLPPLIGGMEIHIAQLTKEQIKLGHDVKIYFNKGNPYSTEKIDADIYFTRSGSESHYGIFFIDRFPKTITLELWHEEENKIFITDTESMFGHLQIGICK